MMTMKKKKKKKKKKMTMKIKKKQEHMQKMMMTKIFSGQNCLVQIERNCWFGGGFAIAIRLCKFQVFLQASGS